MASPIIHFMDVFPYCLCNLQKIRILYVIYRMKFCIFGMLNKEMYGKFHKNQVQARFCKM
jgi:uncharacterized radical SAM superfamily Fe-S cluster-containing enzyme